MRTTDQIQHPASPLETRLLHSALFAGTRMVGNVCRAVLRPRRSRNSLLHLSDRQLRDIGLTRDMLDPCGYDGATDRTGPHRRRGLPLILLLIARGGA